MCLCLYPSISFLSGGKNRTEPLLRRQIGCEYVSRLEGTADDRFAKINAQRTKKYEYMPEAAGLRQILN
jgi:hypothetical protein